MHMNSKKEKYINGLTMFLLVGNTANPFFYLSVEMLAASFLVLVVLWYLKDGQKSKLNGYFYAYAILIVSLQFIQSFVYELFPLKTFLGEYLRIAFALLALKTLGDAYIDTFIKFVLLFAAISLVFYVPSIVIKGFAPFMIKNVARITMAPFVPSTDMYLGRESIILFNFNQIELYRNSGFYWEPGSHGGFLIMALFLNLFYRGETLLKKSSILLLVTILTTLSTTTYLALFVLVIFSLKDYLLRRPVISLSLLAVIIAGAFVMYNKLDFLNNKINKQLEYSNKGVPGESRFNSFLADLRILSEHPIIGTGRNIEMKFGKKFYNLGASQVHRNNGIGVLLATYGVFFFALYFYLMWVSFCKILGNRRTAAFGVLMVVLIGFSEDYFFKVFFISLVLYCGLTWVAAGEKSLGAYRKLQLGGKRISNTIA